MPYADSEGPDERTQLHVSNKLREQLVYVYVYNIALF